MAQDIVARAAEQLELPTGRRPADDLTPFKRYLKDETVRLKKLHRGGGLGRELCRARALVIDELLRHLLTSVLNAVTHSAGKGSPPIALVATGGYGRGELNPQSDIDIMFLHDGSLMKRGGPSAFLQEVTDGVLYPLWDLGLKIGHAVRGTADCVAVANEDMQSKTSLFEARLVAGDAAGFEKMEKTVRDKCVRGQEQQYIAARLIDQKTRRAKFGNAVTMQEPNVKNGCGGLRDYQNLIWMMDCRHGYKTVADLEEKKILTCAEAERLEAAYSFLLRVRNELHYQLERPVDALSKAVQPKVAWRLGYTNPSPAKRLEAFMGDYYRHARNIDLITRTLERRLALVPEPAWRQALSRLVGGRDQEIDGFKIVQGEVRYVSRRVFRDQPRRLMRVFLLMQRHGVTLHPDLSQLLRQRVHLVDREFREDAQVHETFLEILNQRGDVGRILRQMHELDFLGKYLPEFGRLTCLVQHEFYHQYTVDEHTLVCLEKLDALYEQELPEHRQYHELFEQLERPFVLYLALLLHDAGKGIETDRHEREGARVAEHVADRLGIDAAATECLHFVIRHHLAMVQVAQRRDLEDPQVIEQFAGFMKTQENLAMLTLHTVADSLGTSRDLWNGFKDASHWTLFLKTQSLLTGTGEGARADELQRDEQERQVNELLNGDIDPEELSAHFDHLPARYFRSHPPEEIAADVRLVNRFLKLQVLHDNRMLEPVVSWRREPARGYAVVSICTWDRSGLFSRITGVLAECGLNILGALIFTREDSIALDRFLVTDARTGQLPKGPQREQCADRLAAALAAEKPVALDLNQLPSDTLEYQAVDGERMPVVIEFDNRSSAEFTVIDLEAEDHVGLLYVVSGALAELGLDIQLAKINTEKGAATDSFYVIDRGITKIVNQARQQEIDDCMREAIGELYAA
jgi:[protein-PII] uridylyltransferase